MGLAATWLLFIVSLVVLPWWPASFSALLSAPVPLFALLPLATLLAAAWSIVAAVRKGRRQQARAARLGQSVVAMLAMLPVLAIVAWLVHGEIEARRYADAQANQARPPGGMMPAEESSQ